MNKQSYVQFIRIIRSQRHKIEHIRDYPTTIQDHGYKVGYSDAIGHARQEFESFFNSVVELLKSDNPKFDVDKFIKACEIYLD